MPYVKRKDCSVKKLQVHDFEGVKQQFLINIRAVVTLEEIPKDLILNWITLVLKLYQHRLGQWKRKVTNM